MTLQNILAIAGSIALLIGLFGGGVKAKEIEIPKIRVGPRILSSLVGTVLIAMAIRLPYFAPPAESTPIPATQPQMISSLSIATNPPIDAPTNTSTNTPTDIPTAVPTVTPTDTPSPPPTSPPAVVEVFANQSWQGSGVYVKNDDSIQITYITGQWRARNDVAFADPLGLVPGEDRIADPECLFAMLPSIAGDQALIAKIGQNGEPFNPFKRTRLGEGPLYLRLNDCDKYLHDNSGSVTVRIQLVL